MLFLSRSRCCMAPRSSLAHLRSAAQIGSVRACFNHLASVGCTWLENATSIAFALARCGMRAMSAMENGPLANSRLASSRSRPRRCGRDRREPPPANSRASDRCARPISSRPPFTFCRLSSLAYCAVEAIELETFELQNHANLTSEWAQRFVPEREHELTAACRSAEPSIRGHRLGN
jgi:hypothetical protein